MQSNDLRDFYLDYAEWLDQGAPDNQPFSRGVGLCLNVFAWTSALGIPLTAPLRREMSQQFIAAGLNELYPFNEKGTDHTVEAANKTMHINENRNQWVRNKANAEG